MSGGLFVGLLLISSVAVAEAPGAPEEDAAASQPADLKARAESVVTIHRNVRDPGATAAIESAFALIEAGELEPGRLATYDTRTLEVLFDAVAVASERLRRPDLLDAMEDIFQESLRRGFLGNMADRMFMGYVQRRDWQKARQLDERFPSRARELPEVVEPAAARDGAPAVYVVSDDGQTLTYTPVDLAGPVVVSVVSPGCHFSRDIVKRIEADPRLTALFREHALNVDPSPYSVDAAALARANREGRFRYVVLHRASGWAGIDFSATPQFYFVQDGVVVHKIESVTPGELEAKLAEGLATIGLSRRLER